MSRDADPVMPLRRPAHPIDAAGWEPKTRNEESPLLARRPAQTPLSP